MAHMLSAVAAVAVLIAAPATAQDMPRGLKLDRVVMVMRHGVRPPTKAPAMPAGVAAEAWPDWPVKPGYLTPNGAAAVKRVASSDRARFVAARLLPARGCSGTVRIVADSDQRTIATAQAWADALVPGCATPIAHKPQGESDALFSPIDEGLATLDPARADAAVAAAAGPGGIAAQEARVRPILSRLDAILCGTATQRCGIGAEPSGLVPANTRKRPKLTGALDRGSTVAQILLLEYADGKPMRDVGWGRATAADIARASELHALEFALLARPPYLARANLAGLAPVIAAALSDRTATAPAITMISGHDTNVASLGGLLDGHWQVPGFAADDPTPGGAIVLERLTDGRGQTYVRAVYRSLTIEQTRASTPSRHGSQPYRSVMPIAGCAARGVQGLCTEAAFLRVLSARE